jgi:hypothetical protein
MTRAGRASSAVDHARRVVGDTGSASIEVLEAEGTGIKGHVVLRIRSSTEASGFASASSSSACFRRRLGSRVIETWYVPRVLSQPGSSGAPELAVRGDGTTSPH